MNINNNKFLKNDIEHNNHWGSWKVTFIYFLNWTETCNDNIIEKNVSPFQWTHKGTIKIVNFFVPIPF